MFCGIQNQYTTVFVFRLTKFDQHHTKTSKRLFAARHFAVVKIMMAAGSIMSTHIYQHRCLCTRGLLTGHAGALTTRPCCLRRRPLRCLLARQCLVQLLPRLVAKPWAVAPNVPRRAPRIYLLACLAEAPPPQSLPDNTDGILHPNTTRSDASFSHQCAMAVGSIANDVMTASIRHVVWCTEQLSDRVNTKTTTLYEPILESALQQGETQTQIQACMLTECNETQGTTHMAASTISCASHCLFTKRAVMPLHTSRIRDSTDSGQTSKPPQKMRPSCERHRKCQFVNR